MTLLAWNSSTMGIDARATTTGVDPSKIEITSPDFGGPRGWTNAS
jgi:hypothetical protein